VQAETFQNRKFKLIDAKIFPKSVLIVDDDEFTQEILRQMFSGWGVQDIRQASNGEKAVLSLDAMLVPPDVLICDIFMPDMDGIEFIGELDKRQFKGGLVFVSGVNRDMLEVAEFLAAQKGLRVLATLVKPILSTALRNVFA
jgi:YesN/AraC family two-component response regulator